MTKERRIREGPLLKATFVDHRNVSLAAKAVSEVTLHHAEVRFVGTLVIVLQEVPAAAGIFMQSGLYVQSRLGPPPKTSTWQSSGYEFNELRERKPAIEAQHRRCSGFGSDGDCLEVGCAILYSQGSRCTDRFSWTFWGKKQKGAGPGFRSPPLKQRANQVD